MKPWKPLTEPAPEGEKRPIMMLNLTAQHLASIIYRPASNIRSKEKYTLLPLELWEMILTFILKDDTGCLMSLVRPRSLYPTELITGQKVIICEGYKFVQPAGSVGRDIGTLDDFIYDPDISLNPKNIEHCASSLPKKTDKLFVLPAEVFKRKGSVMWHHISPPDIISRMENGKCNFCNSQGASAVDRNLCPCYGCKGLYWVVDIFQILNIDCGYATVPCPICIDHGLCRDALEVLGAIWYGNEPVERYEEVDRRVLSRIAELGYEAHTSYRSKDPALFNS